MNKERRNRNITLKAEGCLLDLLIEKGIEVPILCNRNGACGKCRVIVRGNTNEPTEIELSVLGKTLLQEGYRLACKTVLKGRAQVIVPAWAEEEPFYTYSKGSEIEVLKTLTPDRGFRGLVASVDMGTTTLSGYLFSPRGNLLSSANLLNPTSLFGADIVTRMNYIQRDRKNLNKVRNCLFQGLDRLLHLLCKRTGVDPKDIQLIGICGNTVMQHLFLGINPVDMGLFPYRPHVEGLCTLKAKDLSINFLSKNTIVLLPPVINGFIGGDAVCGIIGSPIIKCTEPALLIDLGTNGEMVLSINGHLLAGSASAGPAFEGYKITSGMRAAVGAIDEVRIDRDLGTVQYSVIGDVQPKGICGTGLISALSTLCTIRAVTDRGHIIPTQGCSERVKKGVFIIATEKETATGHPIVLTDSDVAVLQQAKAAFATGIKGLLMKAGLRPEDLHKIYIAGAFGKSIILKDLKTIGFIPYDIDAELEPVGNVAAIGCSLLVLRESESLKALDVVGRIKPVEFSSMENFEDLYLESLFFK